MENNKQKPQDQEKLKALDQVLAQIEKHYGKGAIMKLGGAAGNTDIEVIPTGCLSLDIALGVGGIPRGRIVEIYGPESSGKTTVALHAIAQAQKAGGIAAFVDAEHALDPRLCQKTGRRSRKSVCFSAGYRRAGSGYSRRARAQRRGRPDRRRFCRGAHPQGRDRGGYGRFARRSAGPPHVAGAAQADRLHQ